MTSQTSLDGHEQPGLPNPLFTSGRAVLAQFGYRPPDGSETHDDWAAMWDRLRGDFAATGSGAVAPYEALAPDTQAAARAYMAQRVIADRNLERCERLHVEIFAHGVHTDLVERYAVARDAYEHSVEDFGAARERLEPMLRSG